MKFLTIVLFHLTFCLCCFSQSSIGIKSDPELAWIQKTITDWDTVCSKALKINPDPLPWCIFYDSIKAWHINPDMNSLPGHLETGLNVKFNGKNYNLIQIQHTDALWVPGRNPIRFTALPTAAMPYQGNKKVFFIAPLPSLFRKLAPPDQSVFLDLIFVGSYAHELTHTRQLKFVLPQLLQVQKEYNLPESIDDNIIESVFSKNPDYKKMFFEEKTHFWNAVLSTDKDSCLAELARAFLLVEKRKALYFSGDSTAYSKLENIFLSLEGSAMWSQYQLTLKYAPKTQNSQQTLFWLLQRAPSWSQEEGLALFLLLEKFVPGWKQLYFEKELPSPFEILALAIKK